jgi:hypothetical protein
MTMNEQENSESFFVDCAEEQSVKPGYIETNLTPAKKLECRQIVRTINDYGVSERQKVFLVYLLALELTDRTLGSAIESCFVQAQNRPQKGETKLLVETPPPGKRLLLG